jgi:mono/diheme cytochrome c family protein
MLSGVGNTGKFGLKAWQCAAVAAIAVAVAWTAPTTKAQVKLAEGDAVAGRELALIACTGCHVVIADQPFKPIYPGPPFPPNFSNIANGPSITAASLQKHLESLAAVAENSHMPKPVLSSSELRDVIAFIISLRTAPSAPAR